MNTFLVNQVNSVHRKSVTADKDKLLLVTVGVSAISSSTLSCSDQAKFLKFEELCL